jgi:hypothetical protein
MFIKSKNTFIEITFQYLICPICQSFLFDKYGEVIILLVFEDFKLFTYKMNEGEYFSHSL